MGGGLMLKPIHIDRVQVALDTITPPDGIGFLVGDGVTSLHLYPTDVWERAVVYRKVDDEWGSKRVVLEPAPPVMEEALKQLFGGDVSAVQSLTVALDEGVYTVILETDIPRRYDSGEMHTERRIGRVLR